MAAVKMSNQETVPQQSQQNSVKKGRGRPKSRQQQQKSVTKDENNNNTLQSINQFDQKHGNNNILSSSCPVKFTTVSSSPFSQINGESNRRSQRKSKEPKELITPKSTPVNKKRKSTPTSETPAKRRRKPATTNRKSPSSNKKSEPEDLAPEDQNWIPIGKPWAEMVSIGSSPTKKAVCCFPAIKHKTENITFNILDVISVAAGEDDGDNIGKIDRIFFDKKLGMCANVLWYYKYNQCNLNNENRSKIEKRYNFDSRELIASKHTDTISCDSIQSHAFVLTFSEYCRYISENKYDSLSSTFQSRCKELWPRGESKYPRRRFLPHEDTPQDSVYFCRKYYSLARKGIYSSAPLPTVAQKRKSLKSRPFNLTEKYYYDSENAENCDKTI